MQFQLGGHHLLHRTNVQYFTENIKCGICEQFHPTQAPAKDSPFLPRRERRGLLARFVDFGIAKEYEPDSTTTAIRHCSPGYGAPEQYSMGTDTRTDIYGLGATIYALLTGVVPADAFYRMRKRQNSEEDLAWRSLVGYADGNNHQIRSDS